ncbi:MAG: lipid A deacylase LpxR family protein [Cytophagales bacterium]|nr:lipid A deacylase LpxR family protein [Cytophagales bacterium]
MAFRRWKLEFRSDNDSYLFYRSDRYYSSGIFLCFNALLPQQDTSRKFIQIQLSHKIFTPVNRLYRYLKNYDRPYAAWACLETSFRIASPRWVRSYGLQLGVLGPHALGKEMQDGIHSVLGMKLARGWDYQISNGWGVNLVSRHAWSLLKEKKAEIILEGMASLGNVFTKTEGLLAYRFGRFRPLAGSSYFRTDLGEGLVEGNELYFFFKIGGGIQFYDATVEGNLFGDKSIHLEEIQPNYLLLEWGGEYSKDSWGFRVTVQAQTAKVKRLTRSFHFFGSLALTYSW